MIVSAYLTGDGAYLHRHIESASPDETAIQVIHIALTDPRWMLAAQAVQHFATSADPIPDLME